MKKPAGRKRRTMDTALETVALLFGDVPLSGVRTGWITVLLLVLIIGLLAIISRLVHL